MSDPCAKLRATRDDLNSRLSECERDLKNNPDHKKIELLNQTLVQLTSAISASKDKNEIAKLTRDKQTIRKDIDELLPKVRPLAASCESLKKLLDDAEGELQKCEEQHKHKIRRKDKERSKQKSKQPHLTRMSLYWETKPGLESDGVTFTNIKSTPEGAYHDTHFTLSWADESGPHKQEWDALVFYRESGHSYTGLLKNGFLSEIMIPIGDPQSRVADAERASGLEFKHRTV